MSSVTAADKFAELEERIIRTIEFVKTTRKQKEAVDRELTFAQKQIARLEEEIEGLKQERDMVKNRVEALLENLNELTEGPIA
jgi:chromosome segregation ATPase